MERSPNSEPATLGSADTVSIETKESSIRSPPAILHASRKHDDFADAGYSIVEVLLAITILAVVLLAAARGVMGGLYAASVAKEHSLATGLMSAAMAEAVALPISDLENGLNPTVDNLANDPNITTSGSTNCSATPPTSGYVLELGGSVAPTSTSTIPVCNTNTSESPLVPHVSVISAGISYTVRTYPTTSTLTPGLVTMVVVVTWKAPSGGTQRVVGEDGIAAP